MASPIPTGPILRAKASALHAPPRTVEQDRWHLRFPWRGNDGLARQSVVNQLQEPPLPVRVQLGEDIVVERDRRRPGTLSQRCGLDQAKRDRRRALLPRRAV